MKAHILLEHGTTSNDGYRIRLTPESAEEAKLLSLTFHQFSFDPRGVLSASHHEVKVGNDTKSLTIDLQFTNQPLLQNPIIKLVQCIDCGKMEEESKAEWGHNSYSTKYSQADHGPVCQKCWAGRFGSSCMENYEIRNPL